MDSALEWHPAASSWRRRLVVWICLKPR